MLAPIRRSNSRFCFRLLLSALLLGSTICWPACTLPQTPPSVPSIPELKSRAESGDESARRQLAEFLVSAEPTSPHYGMALSWLQSLALKRVPEAQYLLGYFYEHGKGLPRDYAKAAENYAASANRGYAPAENNLASLYQRGFGVPKDLAVAFRWYRSSAMHGSASAQLNLGTFYYLGYGTPVDYVEAVKWFRAAADRGLPQAEDDLAHCYLKGHGVPVDNIAAVYWARRAADQGRARAFALLGYLYENGKGVPLDYVSAYAWYARAVAAGDGSSANRLKDLSQIMTRRQLDEANSLVSAQSNVPQSSPAPATLSLLQNH